MIKLDECLSDEDINLLGNSGIRRYVSLREAKEFGRACIALAVQKAEKVEGVARFYSGSRSVYVVGKNITPDSRFRHALLLLGPKYDPKPQKSADQRIEEALKVAEEIHAITRNKCGCGCSVCVDGCSICKVTRPLREKD